jgi:hypothetical protein
MRGISTIKVSLFDNTLIHPYLTIAVGIVAHGK